MPNVIKFTPIIGLEVHVELNTKSKMFCSCSATHFHVPSNIHTCPVCLGLPGALPVPNKTACQWCIKLGLALNCTPNKVSFFERKNYFYPDLPKGYQITQLEKPFVVNGYLDIDGCRVGINRAHMEEDTGKSVHITENGKSLTLIDYNRSSVPLVEIVSEPDILSAQMAKNYLLKIQQIIRYLEISDADIEKGSMRCEPTVNLKIEDEKGNIFYTPLAEIKNVASLTGVQNAIDYEIKRQLEAYSQSGELKSKSNKTTRGWDAVKNQTFLQREKEGSSDYRYFPEPDIPPMEFSEQELLAIKSEIPELPDQKINRYQEIYDLSLYDATQISENRNFALIYEKVLSLSPTKDFAKFVANLFLGAIKSHLNDKNEQLLDSKIQPQYFLDLFNAMQESQISSTVAKQVIVQSYQNGENPIQIAKREGLLQLSGSDEIEKIAKIIIEQNPKAVSDYQKNPASIGFLLGQLMKESKGAANPSVAKTILEKLLA